MKKLSFEDQMLYTIVKFYPYNYIDIKSLWIKVNRSWDKTIYCLGKSIQLGLNSPGIFTKGFNLKNYEQQEST